MHRTHDFVVGIVLGAFIAELRAAGRISERCADTVAMLAMPDAGWGIKPPSLTDAVREAVRPRYWLRKRIEQTEESQS